MDNRLCGRGRRCIEFCNTHQFDIANGCAPGTGNHNFTFHSLGGLGRSVVDLCLVNANAFHRMLDMLIPDTVPDSCTDHCHLTITVQCTWAKVQPTSRRPSVVLWNAAKWGRYAREVRNQEGQLQEMVQNMRTGNTHELDSLVRNAFRFLAGITVRVFGHALNHQGMQGLTWFDNECRAARDAVRRERERYVAADSQLRPNELLRALTSRYQSLMKSKRLESKAREARELVRNARHDPRMFWKWLHDRKPMHVPVHIPAMHTHFCNVLEAASVNASRAMNASTGQHVGMPVEEHGGDRRWHGYRDTWHGH